MSVTSTGNLKRIIRDFKTVQNSVIHVGIIKAELKIKDGKSTQLAQVAKTQEEGDRANNVPKRPTIRPGIKDTNHQPGVVFLVRNIMYGNGPHDGLNKIGDTTARKIRSNMQSLKTPPLKPATIANRVNVGTINPLVDTGQLARGIKHVVVKK